MKKKRFLYFVPMLLLALLLISCGRAAETLTVPAEAPSAEQPVSPPVPAPPASPPVPSEEPPAPSPGPAPPIPQEAIPWNEAKYHIDQRAIVCGRVLNSKYEDGVWGKPTYLHIGKPYPAPDRFTVVIWGTNRDKFAEAPERYYIGKNICVGGHIREDNGVPQIEVETPGQIHEQ